MDYEKAYKEALNWMRGIYPTLTGSDKEDAEHYFPELKESEDERIKNVLYGWVSYAPQSYFNGGFSREQILSWIDKQKEQKPNIELIQKSWYMEGYHDRGNNKEPKWIIKTGEGGPRYEENPKYGQYLEEKPAEWRKNDTVFLNEIIDFFDNGTVRLQHDLTMYAHWLKSLPERFNLEPKEQKPTEWSEEDESYLQTVINEMEANKKEALEYEHKKYDTIISWLKSLKPQPKQEWSKEETKDLVHILKVLDDCYAYGKHDLSKTDHDNLTSTIKSLRPSWKPSEEQMEALNALNCHGDLSYVGQQKQLISLYDDLKKLM